MNEIKIDKVDKNLAPKTPIKRPNKLVDKKLKRGKIKINKHIKKYELSFFAVISENRTIRFELITFDSQSQRDSISLRSFF